MDDFYATLGVPPNAGAAEIKSRYRFLSHAYHPDKFSSDAHKRDAEEAFKRINEAFQTLSDPRLRSNFDRQRASGPSNQPRSSPPPPRPTPPPPPPPPPQPQKPPEGFHTPPTAPPQRQPPSPDAGSPVPLSTRVIICLAVAGIIISLAIAVVGIVAIISEPKPAPSYEETTPLTDNWGGVLVDTPSVKTAFDSSKPREADPILDPATAKPFDPDSYLASKAPRKTAPSQQTGGGFVTPPGEREQDTRNPPTAPRPNPYADLGAIPVESRKRGKYAALFDEPSATPVDPERPAGSPPEVSSLSAPTTPAPPKSGFEKKLEEDFIVMDFRKFESAAQELEVAGVRQRQREAVAKYPDLGVEGSPFHQAFLAEYRRKKEAEPKFLATPDWPMKLADQVFNKTFRVKPRPAATPVAKDYFTLGSTKDEVLAVQGTPNSISTYPDSFGYGGAVVFFENGKVSSWSNYSGKLKVQLLPSR